MICEPVRRCRAIEQPCDVNGCRNVAQYLVDGPGYCDPSQVCAYHAGPEVRSYWGNANGCSACFVGVHHLNCELVSYERPA